MGFFESLERVFNDVVPIGPEVSGPETNHIYFSSIVGHLKSDDQYLREFNEALEWLVRKRTNDTYLRLIQRGSAVEAEVERLNNEHNGHSVRWRVTFACGKSILVWLRTPDAIQLNRDGKTLSVGYSVEYDHEKKQKARENKKRQEKIAEEKRRTQIAAIPSLKSFLGIKFGDDAAKYADDNNPTEDDDGSILMWAKGNQFLDFEGIKIVVSKFDHKVVAVITGAQKESEEIDEYMQRVKNLLDKKYGFNAVVEDGICAWSWYDAKKWNPKNPDEGIVSLIILSKDDDGVYLMARDEMLFNNMTRRNEQAKADEAVRIAEDKRREDQDAIDAL